MSKHHVAAQGDGINCFWIAKADALEAALRKDVDRLLRHFIQSATPDELAATQDAGLTRAGLNELDAIATLLLRRLEGK